MNAAEVEFLGQKITVKTEGDASTVREVIDLASMKIHDAKTRTPGAAPYQVALLALLDMTEEYVKARRRATDLRTEMTAKTEAILKAVELAK